MALASRHLPEMWPFVMDVSQRSVKTLVAKLMVEIRLWDD